MPRKKHEYVDPDAHPDPRETKLKPGPKPKKHGQRKDRRVGMRVFVMPSVSRRLDAEARQLGVEKGIYLGDVLSRKEMTGIDPGQEARILALAERYQTSPKDIAERAMNHGLGILERF